MTDILSSFTASALDKHEWLRIKKTELINKYHEFYEAGFVCIADSIQDCINEISSDIAFISDAYRNAVYFEPTLRREIGQ
jgi:hypothetical protein